MATVANTLQWTIGQCQLPRTLKTTLYALALIADVKKGYANIELTKATIGRWTSRGERAAREDMADLVRFGVLIVKYRSRGGVGCATHYQVWFDRLLTWTEADTVRFRAMRRERRPGQHSRKKQVETRIAVAGLCEWNTEPEPGSPDPPNPDRPIRRTRIARSGDGTYSDLTTDETVDDGRGAAPEHAPPVAAAAAAPPAPGLRPQSAAFHLLSEVGRRLLAENGDGPVEWGPLRSKLRAHARLCGIEHRLTPELLAGIEDSLQSQRAHYLAAKGGTPPPAPIAAPGAGQEAQ